MPLFSSSRSSSSSSSSSYKSSYSHPSINYIPKPIYSLSSSSSIPTYRQSSNHHSNDKCNNLKEQFNQCNENIFTNNCTKEMIDDLKEKLRQCKYY